MAAATMARATRASATAGKPAKSAETKSGERRSAKVGVGIAPPAKSPASTKTTRRGAASTKKSGAKSKTANKKKAATRPSALVQKVYKTIDGELTKLEKQKGLTSQDRERASRALSQMVTALEKAIDMQRDIAKRKDPGGAGKAQEALLHAEQLREQIAERLERLGRKRPAERSAD